MDNLFILFRRFSQKKPNITEHKCDPPWGTRPTGAKHRLEKMAKMCKLESGFSSKIVPKIKLGYVDKKSLKKWEMMILTSPKIAFIISRIKTNQTIPFSNSLPHIAFHNIFFNFLLNQTTEKKWIEIQNMTTLRYLTKSR